MELEAFSFTWEERVPASPGETFFTHAWGSYVAPDRLECNVGQAVGTEEDAEDAEVVRYMETIAIGDRAWINDNDTWRETTVGDEAIQSAHFFCRSAWRTEVSGEPGEDFGEADTHDGIAVRRGDLVEEGFASQIRIGEVDVALERFEVLLTEAGMVLSFDMEGSGSAPGLAASVGWEYEGGADDVGPYTMRGTIDDLNDPDLSVDEPVAED